MLVSPMLRRCSTRPLFAEHLPLNKVASLGPLDSIFGEELAGVQVDDELEDDMRFGDLGSLLVRADLEDWDLAGGVDLGGVPYCVGIGWQEKRK